MACFVDKYLDIYWYRLIYWYNRYVFIWNNSKYIIIRLWNSQHVFITYVCYLVIVYIIYLRT